MLLNMSQSLASARLYAILDTAYVPRERWVDTCQALIAGGADLIQLRMKKESASERRALLEKALPLFQKRDAANRKPPTAGVAPSTSGRRPPALLPPLIVNDDVSLAREFPGVGLHVGQDDTDPLLARQLLGPGRLIGFSTHTIDQARAALALPSGALSYFAVGPVFATPTKPDYAPVGLALVSQVFALKPALPFFCIGGINRRTLPQVMAAGGRRVVVVSDILRDPDPAAALRALRATLDSQ